MQDLMNNMKEQIRNYKEFGTYLTSDNIQDINRLAQNCLFLSEIMENDSDIIGTEIDDFIRNLNAIFLDCIKTREHFQELKDQESKVCMLQNIKAFCDSFFEIYKGMWQNSTSQEERQYLQQVIPKMQQLK